MKTAARSLMLGMLSGLSAAAGGAAVDTSAWECNLCKFEDGLDASLDLGGGNVSDSSSKFGEYSGLDEQGGFVVGEAAAHYRGEDADWKVQASRLGLDTRSVAAEGGRQGSYRLFASYDEKPHFVSDSARTPFLGSGGESLTLPTGFPAGTTALMPLAGTLQPVDLRTQREELGAGASWTPERAWVYAVKFRHETRDGRRGTAAAFFFNAAELVAPIDYVTDQIDASASYAGARFQAKIAYYGSVFRDDDASLTLSNPFSVPAFPDAVAGELALPPDNEFHQLSFTAGYQLTQRTRATASISYGRMTQDDDFLAPTLNAALIVPALPRVSLDGRANVVNANLAIDSALTDRLRLKAEYAYDDRDNRTPQATYAWVATDMFQGSPRTNLPYGFTQDRLKLRADYRASTRIKAAVGYDHDSIERDFQEVDTTREDTFWVKLSGRIVDQIDLSLSYAHGERSNSDVRTVAEITPPENPLLRKFNMADRTRDRAELRADIEASESVSIGLQADASDDDYSESTIGLTRGKEYHFGSDVTVSVSDRTDLHFFANRQVIQSKQAGSQTFSTPDWAGRNRDIIRLAGIGFRHEAIEDRLDVGADYSVTRSRSEINVDAGTNDPAFPDLSTSRNAVNLYATYHVKDNLSLHAGYWYERYDSTDWGLTGVVPDTIPNVLSLGELSPRHRVHVVALSVRHRF